MASQVCVVIHQHSWVCDILRCFVIWDYIYGPAWVVFDGGGVDFLWQCDVILSKKRRGRGNYRNAIRHGFTQLQGVRGWVGGSCRPHIKILTWSSKCTRVTSQAWCHIFQWVNLCKCMYSTSRDPPTQTHTHTNIWVKATGSLGLPA